MQITELIAALGERIGLKLGLDEAGACTLAVDGMSVVIQEVSEADLVGFWGKIGSPPPEGLERLYGLMLEANHLFRATAGATISRDPESKDFFLCRVLDLRVLDGESFILALERFVNTLENWQRLVIDYRPVAASGETGDGGGDAAAGQGGLGMEPGFIRI